MRVGLVVVTHNSAGEIARCLEGVRMQSRPPDRVIIADSGSTDGTRGIVNQVCARLELRVELLQFDENVGFAVANNRAVARLEDCELTGLLNPDAFPERDWLAALLHAASVWPDAGSYASRLMVAGTDDLLDGAGDVFHVSGLAWRRGYRHTLSQVPDALIARPVFAACAAAALYRRADWQRTGGFDERFFCYAEDVDLGFRLQLLGRACRYVPDAVAFHVGSATLGVGSAFSVYHGYRNLEWTFLKDMPSSLLWRYLPLHLLVAAAQVVWFMKNGHAGSVLAAKRDALRHLGSVLRDRRRVQASRVASADDIRNVLDHTTLRSRFAVVNARAPLCRFSHLR